VVTGPGVLSGSFGSSGGFRSSGSYYGSSIYGGGGSYDGSSYYGGGGTGGAETGTVSRVTADHLMLSQLKVRSQQDQVILTFYLAPAATVTVRILSSTADTTAGGPAEQNLAEVRTVVKEQSAQYGDNPVVWDGKDEAGNLAAPGAYFFEVAAKCDNAEARVRVPFTIGK
jgi:hypothetical protein